MCLHGGFETRPQNNTPNNTTPVYNNLKNSTNNKFAMAQIRKLERDDDDVDDYDDDDDVDEGNNEVFLRKTNRV